MRPRCDSLLVLGGLLSCPVMSLLLKPLLLACGVAAPSNLFEFGLGTFLGGLGIGGRSFALAAGYTLKKFCVH